MSCERTELELKRAFVVADAPPEEFQNLVRP